MHEEDVKEEEKGPACPFLVRATEEMTDICAARGEPIVISPRYVESYCTSARHAECTLFVRAQASGRLPPEPVEPPAAEPEPESEVDEAWTATAGLGAGQVDSFPVVPSGASLPEENAPKMIVPEEPEEQLAAVAKNDTEQVPIENRRAQTMMNVEQATFVPTLEGGELRANMRIGRQSITTAWTLGNEDPDLKALLDHLTVTLQQVSFASSPAGGEIWAEMKIGDRSFVSTWTLDGVDDDLKPALDRLMDQILRGFLGNLESARSEPATAESATEEYAAAGAAAEIPAAESWNQDEVAAGPVPSGLTW